jgi:hypothetical protein
MCPESSWGHDRPAPFKTSSPLPYRCGDRPCTIFIRRCACTDTGNRTWTESGLNEQLRLVRSENCYAEATRAAALCPNVQGCWNRRFTPKAPVVRIYGPGKASIGWPTPNTRPASQCLQWLVLRGNNGSTRFAAFRCSVREYVHSRHAL